MIFDWDEHNIAHIARHDVLPAEAEQVIANQPLELFEELRSGEQRLRQVGTTDTGRILLVVTTIRGTKIEPTIRVVTAHTASRRLRAYYVSTRRLSR
jgi:uncharacterized DUF497 family protein